MKLLTLTCLLFFAFGVSGFEVLIKEACACKANTNGKEVVHVEVTDSCAKKHGLTCIEWNGDHVCEVEQTGPNGHFAFFQCCMNYDFVKNATTQPGPIGGLKCHSEYGPPKQQG